MDQRGKTLNREGYFRGARGLPCFCGTSKSGGKEIRGEGKAPYRTKNVRLKSQNKPSKDRQWRSSQKSFFSCQERREKIRREGRGGLSGGKKQAIEGREELYLATECQTSSRKVYSSREMEPVYKKKDSAPLRFGKR